MTELELAAKQAWTAMWRDLPSQVMGPAIALDMVQDVCGERDQAVEALLWCVAIRLDEYRPESPGDPIRSVSLNTAISARGHLLGESYGLAEESVKGLRELNRAIRMSVHSGDTTFDPEDDARSAAWLRWCCYMDRAIKICRQLSAAVHPVAANFHS